MPSPDRAPLSPVTPSGADRLPPRLRFRRALEDRVGSIDDVAWYLEQALPRFPADPEVRIAVEELIDRAGRGMGYETRRDDRHACSVWTSSAGARLIVTVDDGPGARARIGRVAGIRDALLASLAVDRQDQVTGLVVVTGDDVRRLEETVRVRRAADLVRVVSTGALLALGRLAEQALLTHADAADVLQPSPALADRLATLLTALAERASVRTTGL